MLGRGEAAIALPVPWRSGFRKSRKQGTPRARARWLALAVGVVLLPLVGAGPVNGDAAVYAHQGSLGDLAQRTVHVGYVALAAVLARIAPGHLDRLLDLVNIGAVVGIAWLWGERVARRGGRPEAAVLAFLAVAAPLAPFAEVDALWVLGVVGAVCASRVAVAAGCLAGALTVSPVALLAVPWVVATRREYRGAAFGLLLWLPVLVGCGADWWVGPRGVLADTAAPASWTRLATAWGRALLLPGLMAPLLWGMAGLTRRELLRGLLAVLPLFLGVRHADVPAWLLAGVWVAETVGHGSRGSRGNRLVPWLLWLPLGLQLAWGLRQAVLERDRVVRHEAVARDLARRAEPGAAVVAPWSWGVRYSLHRAGSPYGARWYRPGELPEDEDSEHRAPGESTVFYRLPPGAVGPEARCWTSALHGVMRSVPCEAPGGPADRVAPVTVPSEG